MTFPPNFFPSSSLFFVFAIFIVIVNIPMFRGEDEYRYSGCRSAFHCGRIKDVTYPFWGGDRPNYCGHPDFKLECLENSTSKIEINSLYRVLDINQNSRILRIARTDIWGDLCLLHFVNTTINPNLIRYVPNDVNLTLFYRCPSTSPSPLSCKIEDIFSDFRIAFSSQPDQLQTFLMECGVNFVVPVVQEAVDSHKFNPVTVQNVSVIEEVLRAGFDVAYDGNVAYRTNCRKSGGQCGYDLNLRQPTCYCSDGPEQTECAAKGSSTGKKVAIGTGTGIGGVLLTCVIFLLYQRHKRNKLSSSSTLISRDISNDLSLTQDPEKGNIYFQTPIFTYKQLDEATNHFDSSKELGDGGFGTVYHGKLRDGRVVAVKRLFEHNYKRVEQFMNEIEILSRLRHQNLVSLYGCTSQHSRELLLVYEYVPNGTVADHLHGDRAKAALLTWPIRMSIAIESADALTYLHASEIIHRDVKTNNILLDNSFHVKVADFGLSRLFPTDVTHVSTAPQGTPGYVDPEYYQCYQLNNKSDVYSFGVVLIELISSKPAVDIGRHRHEINLANMAINRIQTRALNELVDPSLGFESDYNVRNMITLVAELAFRCLQQENEMRPSMVEVLETLRGIESEEYKKKMPDEMDISAAARLLKNSQPLSPDSVTDLWGSSKATTPNTSA